VVFIPLWQRGIKGDFKITLRKSPLAPLACLYGRKKIAKEGYDSSLVLLEPITEGLLCSKHLFFRDSRELSPSPLRRFVTVSWGRGIRWG